MQFLVIQNNRLLKMSILSTKNSQAIIWGETLLLIFILCVTKDGRRFLIEMQNDFCADNATKAFTEFCRLIARWDAEVIHPKKRLGIKKRQRNQENAHEQARPTMG